MVDVVCLDGSVLAVLPVPVLDREGSTYEVTLRLLRDGEVFGEVGERCGFFLRGALDRVRAATTLPRSSLEVGVRAWVAAGGPPEAWDDLQRHLPRDRELFAFLARDPDDVSSSGELRVRLRTTRTWVRGAWQVRHGAELEAWGSRGRGVRAPLEPEQLSAWLQELVAQVDALVADPGQA